MSEVQSHLALATFDHVRWMEAGRALRLVNPDAFRTACDLLLAFLRSDQYASDEAVFLEGMRGVDPAIKAGLLDAMRAELPTAEAAS
jgi:hypothetical protein